MEIKAHAKLNLTLDVLGKRPDGYHDMRMIMQSIGYDTIAAGDSFNDLGMILNSKAGFLFKSTEAIKAAHPELPAYEEFGDLLAAIKRAL